MQIAPVNYQIWWVRLRQPDRHGSYVGFDRHKGMVDWCTHEIGSRDPRFRFDYFALKSVYTAWDQQAGTLDAETFRFPYPDAAFDCEVLLGPSPPNSDGVHW